MKIAISAFLVLILASCTDRERSETPTPISSVLPDLERYAASVVEATNGAVAFVSVTQTTADAFQIQFKSGHEALMSQPGAEPGNAAYLSNVGRTKAWSTRFCTPELKAIMSRFGVDIVTGNLTDLAGDTQSMAIC